MKEKQYGNQDQKEKNRKLTEAEKRRQERYEAIADEMVQEGYRKTELTISIIKANVFAVILLIPVMIIGLVLFFMRNRDIASAFQGGWFLWMILLFLLFIVVHELIHGISWAFFAQNHFRDIEFGFMKEYMTPYCTCAAPLSRGQYIFGALTPLVILGIIPMIYGIYAGSFLWLILGILMTDSAAGDIMIVWNILRYKSQAEEVVYMDHPTQGGGVIFEK